MELRHLRYFVAVAESLHFGRAATKLRIAQPSLSHQIAHLESELQTSLLTRTKRHVELTDAGRLFLQEARDVIARADRAALIAKRIGISGARRLTIGIGYCTHQQDIVAVIGEFHAGHQDIHVETRTMSVPLQLAALADGRLDVGFVRPPVDDPALRCETVIREPLLAALPQKHPLVARTRLSLSALANEPFVLPPRDAVPVFHDAVLKACREAGFVPHSSHEADRLPTVLGLVAAGAGVALVPASARTNKQSRLVFKPLHPSPDALETAVAWRRADKSPIVGEFISAARRTLPRRRRELMPEALAT